MFHKEEQYHVGDMWDEYSLKKIQASSLTILLSSPQHFSLQRPHGNKQNVTVQTLSSLKSLALKAWTITHP